MNNLTYIVFLFCSFLISEFTFSQKQQYKLEDLSRLSENELKEVDELLIVIDSVKLEQLELIEKITSLELLQIYHYGINCRKIEKLITKSLRKIEKVNSLMISFDSLSYVPAYYKSCNEVKSIGIHGNALSIFPNDLYMVKSLNELYISVSRMPFLNKNISKISNLKILEITTETLEEVPSEIGKLIYLQRLYIFSKKLDSIPNIWQNLAKLEELIIVCEKLKLIEGDFATLLSLKSLQIKDAFFLEKVPSGLSSLPELWEFRLLDAWKINTLKSVANSSSLTELYITGADLTHIIDEINSLNNLEYLVIDVHYLILLSDKKISSISHVPEIKLERMHKEENGPSDYIILYYEVDSEQFQRINTLIPSATM